MPIHGPLYNLPTEQIQKAREFKKLVLRKFGQWRCNGLAKIDTQIKSLCYKRQLFNSGKIWLLKRIRAISGNHARDE